MATASCGCRASPSPSAPRWCPARAPSSACTGCRLVRLRPAIRLRREPMMNAPDATAARAAAVILAAGKGTRMGSDLAKVLHPLRGKPLVAHVLDTCVALGVGRTVVVVGYQREQ